MSLIFKDMEFILYMAITANGYIATLKDETPWSDEEWKEYLDNVKKVDCVVIGRRTYEKSDKKQLKDFGIPIIVLSKQAQKTHENIFFIKSIDEVLTFLKSKKLEKVMIAGGGKLNNEFMKRKLISEIYLDVEPFIFGNGIQLLFPDNYELNLKLLGFKKLNDNTIQLHYQVLK